MTDLVAYWRELFVREDSPDARDMVSCDVQLHSPMMHTPQTGEDLVAAYIVAAHEIFKRWNFDYVRGFQNEKEICMEFEGTVDGVLINGVDIIRWNADDKIEDFKIIVRPAKGLQKLGEIMVPILAEVQQSTANE